MKRWIALPAAMLLLALAIAGCGSSDDTTGSEATATTTEAGGGSEEASDGGKSVVYISPVAAQPGQQQINQGLEQAAEELGWSEFVLDSAASPDKQVSNVEIAINKGVAAISSWTLDPNAVAGAYEQAQAKGIPVIGMNSQGTGVTATAWWEVQTCGPGNPQQVSAEKIAEMKPNAKVVMIGLEFVESIKSISDCFEQEAKAAGLEIINKSDNETDSAAGAQKVFEPLLTKYPDVEAVWGYNDETALGVSAALLAGGKMVATTDNPDGVIVTGSNGDQGAIEAVEQGRLSWTWDPNNLATGFAAVKLMDEAQNNKKPEDLVVESTLVDDQTVLDYLPPEEREYTLDTIPVNAVERVELAK